MSFTPDEIQAFNTILEQKLAQHRREMEHVFEQRIQLLKRDVEQRLNGMQQEMSRVLTQGFGEQNRKLRGMLGELVVSSELLPMEGGGTDETREVDADLVETEIDWEDLSEFIGQAVGEHLQGLQDVFKGIEQLERIVESMQVAMTTNMSLLSNRLYHHQQLPLERAHPGRVTATSQEALPLKRIQLEEERKDER